MRTKEKDLATAGTGARPKVSGKPTTNHATTGLIQSGRKTKPNGKLAKNIRTTDVEVVKSTTKPPQKNPGLRERMLAKLKESNLDDKDAKRLKLEPMTTAEAANLKLSAAHDGFLIPYWTPEGKPLNGMFRYRNFDEVLRTVHTNGFLRGVVEEKKIPKYLQPKGSEPHLWLDLSVDWLAVMKNPSMRVYITEGELKAACANKMDLTTVGLGGVFNYQNKRLWQTLIPEIRRFQLQREWVIVFDSDSSINRDVAVAEARLARLLSDEGGIVKAVKLPALNGKKTGFDDFLVKAGKEEFEKLLQETGLYPTIEALYQLNDEIVHVRNPSMYVEYPKDNHPPDQRRYRAMKRDVFVNENYADRTIVVTDANGKPKPLSAAKEWIKWPGQAEVDSLTYAPGEERIVNGSQLNTWEGWGCEPKKGDVRPFLELFNALSKGMTEEHRKWFLQWLAWPIQHPGREGKLNTAVVLWGVPGTGKTALGYTLREVYGKTNFAEVTRRELLGDFDEWKEGRQFVLGEEITGSDPRGVRDLGDVLKHLITSEVIWVNLKNVAKYPQPSCMNFLFLSNHSDCMDIKDDDRRLFIHEVTEKLPEEFWGTEKKPGYWAWFQSEEGKAAVHWYLKHGVDTSDTSGFNPKGEAPRTDARKDMVYANLNAAGRLAHTLRDAENPEDCLGASETGRYIWTLKLLIDMNNIANPDHENQHINVWTLRRALRDAGFRPTKDSIDIALPGGQNTKLQLWVIFHRKQYEKWTAVALGEAFSAQWGAKSRKVTEKQKQGKNTE